MRGGQNAKPYIQAVREGTVRGRQAPLVLPPTDLIEPNWSLMLPGKSPDEKRLRERCSELWEQLAPVLFRSVGLVHAQQEVLTDYIISTARIEQCERAISIEGLIVEGQRGPVRNPLTTVVNSYRTHRRGLTAELGLSPATAARLTRTNVPDDDDPFD